MDKITINARELIKIVNEIKKDNMDYIEISIVESDGDDLPHFVALSAWTKENPEISVDYDEIDAIE